jgi:hypothetical protein
MHAGLIVFIVLLAWLLGPLILKWAGGLFALGALAVALLDRRNPDQVSLLFAALVGGLAWALGIAWQRGRDAGRGRLIRTPFVGYVPALRWVTALRGLRRRAGRRSPNTRASDETVFDGIAHDHSANGEADESLREDVERTLEQAHRHLEPIVYELFVLTGAGWRDRLSAARRQRGEDQPAVARVQQPFEDRCTLFSVIANDWTLIGSSFMRDPSGAGCALCAISSRQADGRPRQDDPAAARQAFGEICAALRPEAVHHAMNPTKPWAW